MTTDPKLSAALSALRATHAAQEDAFKAAYAAGQGTTPSLPVAFVWVAMDSKGRIARNMSGEALITEDEHRAKAYCLSQRLTAKKFGLVAV